MTRLLVEEIWVVGDECSNAIDVVDANGEVIVQVINDNDEVTERDRAVARLVAKVPEMASLLLRAFTHVTHGPKREEVEKILREAGVL